MIDVNHYFCKEKICDIIFLHNINAKGKQFLESHHYSKAITQNHHDVSWMEDAVNKPHVTFNNVAKSGNTLNLAFFSFHI